MKTKITVSIIVGIGLLFCLPSSAQNLDGGFPSYDIALGFSGLIPTNAVASAPSSRNYIVPAGLPGTAVSVGTRPTKTEVFTLSRIPSGQTSGTVFGTITISTTGQATPSSSLSITFFPNDTLTITPPSQMDPTLRNVMFSIATQQVILDGGFNGGGLVGHNFSPGVGPNDLAIVSQSLANNCQDGGNGNLWCPSIIAGNTDGGGIAAQWVTLLNCDLTTQPTQVLTSDGTYSICGISWTKANSSHDRLAMTLQNGTGLVICPDNSGRFGYNVRTAPILSTLITNIVPNYTWYTPIRTWVYLSSHNSVAAADEFYAPIEEDNGSNYTAQVVSYQYNSGSPGFVGYLFSNSNSGSVQASGFTNSTPNVIMMTLPSSPQVPITVYTGSYSAGFPSINSLNPLAAIGITNTSWASLTYWPSPTAWDRALSAATATTTTCFTVSAIKFDAILLQ